MSNPGLVFFLWLEKCRRPLPVANLRTLPQKWPPPPWKVAGSCRWTPRLNLLVLDRFTLDQKGAGFDAHILLEHNPRWYFFFLLHVKSRPKSKLTGQEAYVLEKVPFRNLSAAVNLSDVVNLSGFGNFRQVWPTDPRHSRSYHWSETPPES